MITIKAIPSGKLTDINTGETYHQVVHLHNHNGYLAAIHVDDFKEYECYQDLKDGKEKDFVIIQEHKENKNG